MEWKDPYMFVQNKQVISKAAVNNINMLTGQFTVNDTIGQAGGLSFMNKGLTEFIKNCISVLF